MSGLILRKIRRVSRGEDALTPLFRTQIHRFLSQKHDKIQETYFYYQTTSKLFQHFLVIISCLNSLESIQEQSGWKIITSSFFLSFFSILELFQIEKRSDRHREEWIKCKKNSACDLETRKRPQKEKRMFKGYLRARDIVRVTSSTLSLVEIFTTQLNLVPIFLIALFLAHNFGRWTLQEKRVLKKVSGLIEKWRAVPEGLVHHLGEQDLLWETFDFETDFRYLMEN